MLSLLFEKGKSFNERWFQDWNATPEEQGVKFINLAQHVHRNPYFKKQFLDKPDTQNCDLTLAKMINDAISKQQKMNWKCIGFTSRMKPLNRPCRIP